MAKTSSITKLNMWLWAAEVHVAAFVITLWVLAGVGNNG